MDSSAPKDPGRPSRRYKAFRWILKYLPFLSFSPIECQLALAIFPIFKRTEDERKYLNQLLPRVQTGVVLHIPLFFTVLGFIILNARLIPYEYLTFPNFPFHYISVIVIFFCFFSIFVFWWSRVRQLLLALWFISTAQFIALALTRSSRFPIGRFQGQTYSSSLPSTFGYILWVQYFNSWVVMSHSAGLVVVYSILVFISLSVLELKFFQYGASSVLIGAMCVGVLGSVAAYDQDWTNRAAFYRLQQILEKTEQLMTQKDVIQNQADLLRNEVSVTTQLREKESRFYMRIAHDLRTPLNAILNCGDFLTDKLSVLSDNNNGRAWKANESWSGQELIGLQTGDCTGLTCVILNDAGENEESNECGVEAKQGNRGALWQETWEYLDILRSAGRLTLTLTDNLLFANSLKGGRYNVSCEVTDLRSSLMSCLRVTSPRAALKKLNFYVVGLEALPRLALCDPVRLTQCIINLCTNAMKFTDSEGTVCVQVYWTLLPLVDGFSQIARNSSSGVPMMHEEAALHENLSCSMTEGQKTHMGQNDNKSDSQIGSSCTGGVTRLLKTLGRRDGKVVSPEKGVEFSDAFGEFPRNHSLGLQITETPYMHGDTVSLEGEVKSLDWIVKNDTKGHDVSDWMWGVLTVDVSDTGKGIRSEFLEYVFGDGHFGAAEDSMIGTGIGLHVVRSLSRLMGGDCIGYSDGLGKGSTFRLSLPMLSAPAMEVHSSTIDDHTGTLETDATPGTSPCDKSITSLPCPQAADASTQLLLTTSDEDPSNKNCYSPTEPPQPPLQSEDLYFHCKRLFDLMRPDLPFPCVFVDASGNLENTGGSGGPPKGDGCDASGVTSDDDSACPLVDMKCLVEFVTDLCVVAVDDDQFNLFCLTKIWEGILKGLPFSGFHAVENAFKCFEVASQLNSSTSALFIIDFEMPEVNGAECCQELRRMQHNGNLVPSGRILILLSTAQNPTADHRKHFDTFYVKPFGKGQATRSLAALFGQFMFDRSRMN